MNEPCPEKPAAIGAILIGAGGLLLIAVATWSLIRPWGVEPHRVGPTATGGRTGSQVAGLVGDRVCAECHPGEAAYHIRSGHSRTLLPAAKSSVARVLDGRTIRDPEITGVSWTYALRDGRFTVERAELGTLETFLIDYTFGSGNHAATFVSVTERDPRQPAALEHRLTWYTGIQSLDVTPGHEIAAPAHGANSIGRPLESSKLLRCFSCHTTATSADSRNVLDVATMVPNVTCERCHGPARAHVAAARRGGTDLKLALGPGRWTAEGLLRSCGACHRHPDSTRPDAIRPDNLEIVRHQPVGLAQSKCYKESRGALSCVTCHDPHAPASRDKGRYEASCASCHATPTQSRCPVSPETGCLACHMPRRNSGQGVLFTDHWIRVVRGPASGAP